MNEAEGALVIGLPEPVGRRARLGPFVSGQEALKFAGIAAVGAVFADATSPILWLPFLGVGLLVGMVRIDGKGPDAHVVGYVRWRLRRHPAGRRRPGPRPPSDPEGAIARLPSGRCAAVLRSGGVPIGFLPKRDARALFEGFKGLVRAQGHGLLLSADAIPVDLEPLLPGPRPELSALEKEALAGYREMLMILLRSRRQRRVDVVTWSDDAEADPLDRLEDRVQALTGSLLALGLPVERLRGPALGDALARLGYRGNRR
ncbi:MAG: hypothetical protein L3K08_01360 [Thermoplasmata archaeon]|nr:hypothetical protein [Thermoplasmata archaeon]